MGTTPKFTPELKAEIEALYDMGLKSPAIAKELGLSTFSVTGIVGHIARRRSMGCLKVEREPLEDAGNAKIVLVGRFSNESILSYVARFGASRIEVRP